jgi:1-aminocyclopropane-1-carboxylate deaminase/D-cysteine desulfhydrase-like pyridoxal-dependent ACC family enzyme
MSNAIDYYEMSPVEKHGDIWFKREDLYKPFDDFGISGGKVRQCLALVDNNKEFIKQECDSTLATAASIGSPQNPIVSRVAKHFGFNSIIGIGNTTLPKAINENKTLTYCQEAGSEVIVLSETQGYSNVLYAGLDKLATTRKFFKILFGYQLQSNRKSVVDVISHQVKNIPEEIDTLVVNCGSAVSFIGIMNGVLNQNRKFRVVAIQPFGYDRTKFIDEGIEHMRWEYDYEYHKGNYPYHKKVTAVISDTLELDNVYESKAYHMMLDENIVDPKKENVCYWVIGDANFLR